MMCRICGTEFEGRYNSRYCSIPCRRKAERGKRRPARPARPARLNTKAIPGAPSPHQRARELHNEGKSVLVISGLTGLSRAILAPLLGVARPPTEDGGEHATQDFRLGEREKTPALWGTETPFEGEIKERVYRVVKANGEIRFATIDFSIALHACRKGQAVIDETGAVLAKGPTYSFENWRIQ